MANDSKIVTPSEASASAGVAGTATATPSTHVVTPGGGPSTGPRDKVLSGGTPIAEDSSADAGNLGKVQPIDRAKKMAQDVVDKARDGYGNTKEKLGEVTDEVSKRYERLSSDVRVKAEHASEAARERYDQAATTMREGYTKARKDLDGLAGDLNVYVRDNPAKAVLAAAGIGFLIGLVFRGRSNNDDEI